MTRLSALSRQTLDYLEQPVHATWSRGVSMSAIEMTARRSRERDDLATRYLGVRGASKRLCEGLSVEDHIVQSMPDVSPTKWHLAHTTWFFETFVLSRGPGVTPFHPAFHDLFNSYYLSVGKPFPRAQRGLLSRPSLDEVWAYREHVDAAVMDRLARGDLDAEGARILELGIEHEQQHQELILTDIKHVLWHNPLYPRYAGAEPVERASRDRCRASLRWHGLSPDIADLGHDGRGFCFDNELPRHRVLVPAYELASRLVTAGEYLAFMRDGGYRRPELWLSDGWDFCRREALSAPLYWLERDGAQLHFTLRGLEPIDEDEPVVHVSGYEADAYARWAGARLPREAELELAARGRPVAGNFVESGVLHPVAAASGGDIAQLFGDAWEWTQSAYAPYPGYAPPDGAIGEYNGKFMVNQLVLRGGSCVSPRSHLRASYRNFFPPHARWQFSGIRLARDP
jgi:ergothioneine biosynthesis protein EgtB